jgi:hypothetical protein
VADFQIGELLCPSVTNFHRLIQQGITSGYHDHPSQKKNPSSAYHKRMVSYYAQFLKQIKGLPSQQYVYDKEVIEAAAKQKRLAGRATVNTNTVQGM